MSQRNDGSFSAAVYFLLVSVLYFALCSSIGAFSVVKISSVTVAPRDGGEAPRQIKLPYAASAADSYKLSEYTLRLDYHAGQSGRVQFIPDDCVREISVNGKKLDISAIGQQFLCSWSNGFRLNIADQLHKGSNTVTMRVENLGGGSGIDVRPLPWVLDGPGAVALYVFLVAGWVFARALRGRRDLLAVSCVALAAMFVFSVSKYWGDYQYNMWPNINLIEYASSHFSMPDGQGSQMLLYSLLAGVVYLASSAFLQPGVESWRVLMHADSFLFCMFLLYGLLTIRESIASRRLSLVAGAVLMLWPANLLHVARIDSDILFYLAGAGCTYHFLKWHKAGDIKQFRLSLCWLAVAAATSIYALALVLGMLVVTALRRVPLGTCLKPATLALLLLVAALSAVDACKWASVAMPAIPSTTQAKSVTAQPVAASDFMTFDYTLYMDYPYITLSNWQLSLNRIFADYFLRSMSFGQTYWDGTAPAETLNFLLLMMWCYLAVSLFSRYILKQQSLGQAGYFIIMLGSCVLTLMLSRAVFYADGVFRADARYLYMVVIYFICAYAHVITMQKQESNRVYLLGLTLLLAYGATSFLHICYQLF